MESLDLGFEALVGCSPVSDNNIFKFRNKWFCDWVILEYLQEVAPVCDANMFRLYADKFNIDIENNTEADLVELATMYQKQMILFTVDNIKNRVWEIVNCWRDAIELPGCSSIYKLPVKCRRSMLNLLMLINHTTGTDFNPQFTQFTAELVEATLAKTTFNYDRADTYQIITKDQFHTYITAITPFIDKCFEVKDSLEFEYNSFQTKFKAVVRLVKTIMLMCLPAYEMPFNDAREFFDKFIKNQALGVLTDEQVACLDKLRGLDVSHAVYINSNNLDLVCVDSEGIPETDAYRLILTTLYHDIVDGKDD